MIDSFKYEGPRTEIECNMFGVASGYEWAFQDYASASEGLHKRVPAGWAYAWLEYNRRNESRMSIQMAFPMWRADGTLPGLD
jgi:hypothetical protein